MVLRLVPPRRSFLRRVYLVKLPLPCKFFTLRRSISSMIDGNEPIVFASNSTFSATASPPLNLFVRLETRLIEDLPSYVFLFDQSPTLERYSVPTTDAVTV